MQIPKPGIFWPPKFTLCQQTTTTYPTPGSFEEFLSAIDFIIIYRPSKPNGKLTNFPVGLTTRYLPNYILDDIKQGYLQYILALEILTKLAAKDKSFTDNWFLEDGVILEREGKKKHHET